jgi:hypothetical protein
VKSDEPRACVLINIGHCGRSPVSPGPALRVLGLFGDADCAREHLSDWSLDVDAHLVPLGQWFAVTRVGGSDERARLERLLSDYDSKLKRCSEDFEAKRSARSEPQLEKAEGDSVDSVRAEHSSAGDLDSSSACAASVPRHKELRAQAYAVVSVVLDHRSPAPEMQEPACVVWRICETEDEAKACIREELSEKVVSYHLDVVAMYEWIKLYNLDFSQVHEEYRNEDLNLIMNYRKGEAARVAAYRKQCAALGEVPSEIVIGENARAAVDFSSFTEDPAEQV